MNKDTVKNKMRDREEIYIARKTSELYQAIVIYESYLNTDLKQINEITISGILKEKKCFNLPIPRVSKTVV